MGVAATLPELSEWTLPVEDVCEVILVLWSLSALNLYLGEILNKVVLLYLP